MSFTPILSSISNITNACPAVVTTTIAHGLFTGAIVRLTVPQAYGMQQLNNKQVSVTVLSPTTFSCQYSQVPPGIQVDSTNFYPWVSATDQRFQAQVIPMGSGPTPITILQWQANNNFCESTISDTFLNNSTVEIPF
jgi:hypothetical protein